MRNKAFTLIELLVVIAIIAILAAILFPVFAQAKVAAKKAACISNVKQMATAAQLYLSDNDDLYPLNSVNGPSGYSFSNTYYWYFGLVFQNASLAKLQTSAGILYPYQKSGQIVNCPDGTNLKPSTGGAPFTIDASDAPLGYDKNILLVYSQATATGTYGPFPNATSWEDVSNSILLADAGFAPTSYGIGSSSFNGLALPKSLSTLNARSCTSANIQGRHGTRANVAFQDTHAKSIQHTIMPDYVGSYSAYCKASSTGFLVGPGVSITPGAAAPANTNYYYVPDKSSTNPYN